MYDRAIRSTVQILNAEGTRCVGMGFIAPHDIGAGPRVVVVTCAHVVATALNDEALNTSPRAPDGTLQVRFPGSRKRIVAPARAIAGGWAPNDPALAAEGEPRDVAVLAVSLESLPEGCEYPCFAGKVEVRTEVQCFGPDVNGWDGIDETPQSVESDIRASGDPTRIEFLVEESKQLFMVIPGFSGGPLFQIDGSRIIGMVRSVKDGLFRQAYAIPIGEIGRAWKPVGMVLGAATATARVGDLHPAFDLIDRRDQVDMLPAPLEAAIRERLETGRSAPWILTFVGGHLDDVNHFARRLCREIESHRARGRLGISTIPKRLQFPGGRDTGARLRLFREKLAAMLRLTGDTDDDLRAGLNDGAAAWLFQLGLPRDLDAGDIDLLGEILALYGALAEGVNSELYLALCFGAGRDDEPSAAALWLRDLEQAHEQGAALPIVPKHTRLLPMMPLALVEPNDVLDWFDGVDPIELDLTVDLVNDAVIEMFDTEHALPMLKLRQQLRRLSPDPAGP